MNAKQVEPVWNKNESQKESPRDDAAIHSKTLRLAERTGSGPSVSHRPPPHPIAISTQRANDGRVPKTTEDDMAVVPVWNARARSSFLIAQAMRPRGFVTIEMILAIVSCLVIGGLITFAERQDRIIDAQRETIRSAEARAELQHMRADHFALSADRCSAAVLPAIDTLRKCRAVLEARDEACSCWLAPEGGAQ